MRSTFFGLNIGINALLAQQRALDITSHNVANANTQGYSRQDVIMGTTTPVKVLEGYVGSGVKIQEFRRIRDTFIDAQLRKENQLLGEWETKADVLSKAELIINEPSESGLRSVIEKYWEAWQTLSSNPESAAARDIVVQRGVDLVDLFGHTDRLLKELQDDINKQIGLHVKEINSLGVQIRDLNNQIVKAELSGAKANDLRDKRDLLVEQLSNLLPVDVLEDSYGALTVTTGGATLVSSNYVGEMRFTDNLADSTQAKLEWINAVTGNTIAPVNVNGGSLKGYIEMRDGRIAQLREELSALVGRIAEEVNALHSTGSGLNNTTGLEPGIDFFSKKDNTQPFGADNIMVNPELLADLNKLAASKSSPVVEGDGSNALDIARIRSKLTMNPTAAGDYMATFDDYYRSVVGHLGIDTQEAQRMVDNQDLLVGQLHNRREAVSGVSLDEEMANMIKYQHAYSAASRIINAMDEMLDVVINRLGMVGR